MEITRQISEHSHCGTGLIYNYETVSIPTSNSWGRGDWWWGVVVYTSISWGWLVVVVWEEGMFEINSIQTALYFLQLRWMVVGVKFHQLSESGGGGE